MRNTSIGADHKSGRRREKPVIFIETESNDVLKKALEWGKKERFKVLRLQKVSFFLSLFYYDFLFLFLHPFLLSWFNLLLHSILIANMYNLCIP